MFLGLKLIVQIAMVIASQPHNIVNIVVVRYLDFLLSDLVGNNIPVGASRFWSF